MRVAAPLAPRPARRLAEARRLRRRRRADGRHAHRPRRHQRGVRRDAHPGLRPRVARRHGYADVYVADGEGLSPASPKPHVLIAFNMPGLVKSGPDVLPGGTILYDSSVITDCTPVRPGVKVVGVPMSEIAMDLARPPPR